jgi:hypothetical protein
VTQGPWRTGQEKRIGIGEGQAGSFEWQETIVSLLRHQVVLLAMKYGRAPLPVSSALCKGLLRQGVLKDLCELGNIARRLSFLGDERMLLAELRVRTAATPPVRETLSKEGEIAAEDRPQIKDANKCR